MNEYSSRSSATHPHLCNSKKWVLENYHLFLAFKKAYKTQYLSDTADQAEIFQFSEDVSVNISIAENATITELFRPSGEKYALLFQSQFDIGKIAKQSNIMSD